MHRTIARLALGVLGLVLLFVSYIGLRHVVYWAPTEDVAFANGDVVLAGTLVKPASKVLRLTLGNANALSRGSLI